MTHAAPRRRTHLSVALAAVAALGWFALLAREDPALAAPETTVTYATAAKGALHLWRESEGAMHVTVYEIGHADPDMGTGWRPVENDAPDGAADPAPQGPFLFRVDAVGAPGAPLAGRIVAASGVHWDAGSSRFVSGSSSGDLTEWLVADGEVVAARLHRCLRIPPGFEIVERQGPAGRLERRTIMGPPPRTLAEVTHVPPAPEGRLLTRGFLGDRGDGSGSGER